MATPQYPLFFYDEQIRRYLLQFARIFSNFQVEYGRSQETLDETPGHTLVRVPVRYGDASRQAQTIMQQNSASNMPSAPIMTFYIQALEYARDRVQEPYFISKVNVRSRAYVPDPLDPQHLMGTYESTQGNTFTIERPMPTPYTLTMNLDIWTTNTNQKFQILEQIVPLFNPSLEIQATDNFIDWTTLTIVNLTSVKWSSRTIPVGTEDPIDIATLTFEIPIWISPPLKVKKLGVVERIIANIYDDAGDLTSALDGSDILLGTRQVITPYGYQVFATGIDPNGPNFGRIQCVPVNTPPVPPNSNIQIDDTDITVNQAKIYWHPVVNLYGVLREGISYITLNLADGNQVMCNVAYDPTDDRFLVVTNVSGMPSNGPGPITYVNAVIDPLQSGPGFGLPAAAVGQTYLLTNATGDPNYSSSTPNDYAIAWASTVGTPLIADVGDIIQYQDNAGVGSWAVIFTASADNEPFYVTNLTTLIQYQWTGNEWVKSVDGFYEGGEWSLVL